MTKKTKLKYNEEYIKVLAEQWGVTTRTVKRWYREHLKKEKEQSKHPSTKQDN